MRIEYLYDAFGNRTSLTEGDTSTTYSYDVLDRLLEVNELNNNQSVVKTYDYDKRGNQTNEYVDGVLNKTFTFNGPLTPSPWFIMRLTKVTDPEGRTRGYDYDKNGNVVAEYIGDIKVRALEYDVMNRVTKETDALGHTRSFTYDEAGLVTSVTDTLGNKSTREYDLLGRVTKEIDPLGNETSYTYTKLGNIETITDAANRVRRFEYTRGGKLTAIYFCDKLEQALSYDAAGRVSKRTFADGYEISYSYDALSRIEKVNGTDGRAVSYEYDAMGRATKVSDGDKDTLYTYTATGRLKSVVDALSNETVYTYDALDNLKSIHRIDGLADASETKEDRLPKVGEDGHVTIYSYNLAGQLTEVTDALGQKETYEYDQYGRLVTKVDRDNYSTAYSYNDLGRVTRVDYADGKSVALSYDELGRLNEFTDWLGTTSIQRDVLGRVLSVNDYNNKSVSYNYGKLNERTEIVYPDGRTVDYIYDDERKLRELVNGNEKTSYDYDAYGRLIEKTLPNGNAQKFDYFTGGMLKSLEMYDSNGLMDRYTYGYDSRGNRTEVNRFRRDLENISGDYNYGYDLENRLTEVSLDGELIRKYEYDAFGNRTSFTENGIQTTYNYDELDRLIESVNDAKAISFEYDKRGNRIAEYENGLLNKTFTFDATNMLSKVVDNTNAEATYTYNGMGKRVAISKPDEQIEFLLDLTKDYHNMLERSVNGEVETYTYDSNVVSMSKVGDDYFYMLDELGSGMYMTGTDGTVVGTYAYDEFGRTVNPGSGKHDSIAYTKNGNIIQPLAFTGYQRDEMTGSYFAQARYYDSEIGVFHSRDNSKYIKKDKTSTFNIYSYCASNPLRYIDLDGHESIVVSGGPASTDNFQYQFIETAIKDMRDQIASGVDPSEITWVVMNAGYCEQTNNGDDIDNFKDTAQKLGVNIVVAENTDDLIDYMNTKDGGNSRIYDQITNVSFYCHGRTPRRVEELEENELSFAYSVNNVNSNDFIFTQSDIARLQPVAFDNTITYFYSCNSGTNDGSGSSFAQQWSNQTGGVSYGLKNARSLYAFINSTGGFGFYTGFIGHKAIAPSDYWNYVADNAPDWMNLSSSDEWYEKQLRHDRDTNGKGYSEYGSLNYPTMSSLAGDLDGIYDLFDRGWVKFECEE